MVGYKIIYTLLLLNLHPIVKYLKPRCDKGNFYAENPSRCCLKNIVM